MNQLQTDFLCASTSFSAGVGSVLNLSGENFDYNKSDNPDAIALSQDWRIVGQSIANSLAIAKKEITPVAQNE